MEKLICRFFKKADKLKNRIILPKAFIEKWGNEYYMEVYSNKIVLIPTKKGE